MEEWIKKSDAIEAVYQLRHKPNDEEWNRWLESLNSIPSADRPQGEWIEQEDDYHHYWECSECGIGVGLDDIRNFCPNCGARMKGKDNE